MDNNLNGNTFREFTGSFKEQAKERFDIQLTDFEISQFFNYGTILLEWNEKINLTAITHPEEIITKHFLDSLVFVKWIRLYYKDLNQIMLADLGTGAGFPGIPIKIVQPEIKILLIDSLAKRLNFLQEVINSLRLQDIDTYHSRAEDIGRNNQYREVFDITVARAVAELPVLLEYMSPLLKVGGRILAAKALEPEKEIISSQRALQVLNCEVEEVDKYNLGEGAEHRSLIIIKKANTTPKIYPRQPGKPKKNPL